MGLWKEFIIKCMEEEKNTQTKSGESVRKTILAGVFVFAVAAIVSGVNTTDQEVVLYPVEVVSQTANVASAVKNKSTESSVLNSIDVRRIPGEITTFLNSDDFVEQGCPNPYVTYGGADSNCEVHNYNCSTQIQGGFTVLTPDDYFACGGQEGVNMSESVMSCLVNKCLMPAGIDLDILDNLPNTDIDMHIGGSHPVVLEIEQKLQAKGFFTLTPDQTFGYKTLDAIKAFQTANRLSATGILDSQTINLLAR